MIYRDVLITKNTQVAGRLVNAGDILTINEENAFAVVRAEKAKYLTQEEKEELILSKQDIKENPIEAKKLNKRGK